MRPSSVANRDEGNVRSGRPSRLERIRPGESIVLFPLMAASAWALVIAVFLRQLRETRLVRPISASALAIRVIRANVLAEWLFELLPGRKRTPKDRPPPPGGSG